MSFLSQVPYAIETLLELWLLFLLIRGPFRKYVVFSLYILVQVLSHSMVTVAYYAFGFKSSVYRNAYWTDEVALDLFLFLVVIAFTYAAVQEGPLRPKVAKILGVIVAVTLALPFAMLHNNPNRAHPFFASQWFNHAIQIWNFGAAIMNLVLWTALLSNRRRDPQLVMVSIGVGVVTASAAIAWGARQWLPEADRWTVDSFMQVARLVSLLLWCWVFRPKSEKPSGSAPSSGGSKPPSSLPPPNALTTPS